MASCVALGVALASDRTLTYGNTTIDLSAQRRPEDAGRDGNERGTRYAALIRLAMLLLGRRLVPLTRGSGRNRL